MSHGSSPPSSASSHFLRLASTLRSRNRLTPSTVAREKPLQVESRARRASAAATRFSIRTRCPLAKTNRAALQNCKRGQGAEFVLLRRFFQNFSSGCSWILQKARQESRVTLDEKNSASHREEEEEKNPAWLKRERKREFGLATARLHKHTGAVAAQVFGHSERRGGPGPVSRQSEKESERDTHSQAV